MLSSQAFWELDEEIKQEFFEDVQAAIGEIDDCAHSLTNGADKEVIDRMFRSLHTVKGNCKMVFLEDFVAVSHQLEDFFSKIRDGSIAFHPLLAKFANVAVNAIGEQIAFVVNSRSPTSDNLQIKNLQRLESIIGSIQNSACEQRQSLCEKAIIAIEDGHYNLELVAHDGKDGQAFSFSDATDEEFFDFISRAKANIDPTHQNFIDICQTLTLKLNDKLGKSVDQAQLKTAIIFLSFSRAFNPDLKSLELDIAQVFFTSGILNRMAGWSIGADLVNQLLENHDGSGKPMGLQGDSIHPAAQALALATEFTLHVLSNSHLSYKQSLFAAVKSINHKKNSRFKSRLIERFNDVIKSDYLNTSHW